MNPAPRWYLPVAIVALAWNLLGCLAYLADVRHRDVRDVMTAVSPPTASVRSTTCCGPAR